MRTAPKKHILVDVCSNSKSGKCINCIHKEQRKCDRPTKDILLNELMSSNPYALGKKYGVSDNAIRKWMVAYEIPTKKSELAEYLIKH